MVGKHGEQGGATIGILKQARQSDDNKMNNDCPLAGVVWEEGGRGEGYSQADDMGNL